MAAGTGTAGFVPPPPPEPRPNGFTINLVDLWPAPERDPLPLMFEAGIISRSEFRMLYEERAIQNAAPPCVIAAAR